MGLPRGAEREAAGGQGGNVEEGFCIRGCPRLRGCAKGPSLRRGLRLPAPSLAHVSTVNRKWRGHPARPGPVPWVRGIKGLGDFGWCLLSTTG